MKINRKIEKMFIDEQNKFDEEIETIFYQKESNTLEYYEMSNYLEVLDATITNCFACEFYLSHSYKYLREYLSINNSLSILGAVKDDPKLIICIELLKNLSINVTKLKSVLLNYYILLKRTITYQPSKSPNMTLQVTSYYSNVNKKPKTPEEMINLIIRSLFRSELCFEAIDYLLTYFIENMENKIGENIDDYELLREIKEIYPELLDNYLEFKMTHFVSIDF